MSRWNRSYSSQAPSQETSNHNIYWQTISELLDVRHLLFDSIQHPIEAFYAYFPIAAFAMVHFTTADIPDLKDKVILVTGGMFTLNKSR